MRPVLSPGGWHCIIGRPKTQLCVPWLTFRLCISTALNDAKTCLCSSSGKAMVVWGLQISAARQGSRQSRCDPAPARESRSGSDTDSTREAQPVVAETGPLSGFFRSERRGADCNSGRSANSQCVFVHIALAAGQCLNPSNPTTGLTLIEEAVL